MSDVWALVAAERGALADDLSGLTDAQWETQSLCDRWSVREVLAHMIGSASLNPLTFVLGMVRARFDFQKVTSRLIARHIGATPADTLAAFRAVQYSTSSPPGPAETWLGETIVHAEDIRRPLGIVHAYDIDAVRKVADHYKGSNLLMGAKSRMEGLRLVATDIDWSHSEGEEVAGPMLSLLIAMTGRGVACDDLTGPGVPTLRERAGRRGPA
jgi:uncharacterized protein (TIGR03083 family)